MRELPAEVDRVADSGIHALTAYGAMDVPRVTQKKALSHAEPFGDAMVNTVCREPIQFRNLDIELMLYSLANIVKREISDRIIPTVPGR